jgi:CubicO group peptidase (beta-lactamase class C family)
MTHQHIPGLSLGVARNGRAVYQRGYGVRDVAEPALAVDAYTVYPVGSITKQFTAALVLQQIARGNVALDAPLATYLPAFAKTPARAVTVAQLLSQTSGIASYTDAAPSATARAALPDLPPQRFWQPPMMQPLAFTPGTSWQYSNTNYAVLGAMLEAVAGEPYARLLASTVLTPLGLQSTAYGQPPYANNVARGYSWSGTANVEQSYVASSVSFASSAGALWSNAPDLLVWLDALRRGRVVPVRYLDGMTQTGRLADGAPTNYAYGFYVAGWYGHHVIEHAGNVDGFSSQDAVVLDDGLELAILSNQSDVDLAPLAQSIVAILDPVKDPAEEARPNVPPQNENSSATAAARAFAQSATYARYGDVQSVEFIERSTRGSLIADTYRLRFANAQFVAIVLYAPDGSIERVTAVPAVPR